MEQIEQIKTLLDKCSVLHLPVRTIDSIKVDAYLRKTTYQVGIAGSKDPVPKVNIYTLSITSRKLCVNSCDCCDGDMAEKCEDSELVDYSYYTEPVELDELPTVLSSLKFNRYECRFDMKQSIDWSFLTSESVKLRYEQCCVCLEATNMETNCKHALCVPCYDNIKRDVDGDTPCPLCREACNY
jgi:hypothetical protein